MVWYLTVFSVITLTEPVVIKELEGAAPKLITCCATESSSLLQEKTVIAKTIMAINFSLKEFIILFLVLIINTAKMKQGCSITIIKMMIKMVKV